MSTVFNEDEERALLDGDVIEGKELMVIEENDDTNENNNEDVDDNVDQIDDENGGEEETYSDMERRKKRAQRKKEKREKRAKRKEKKRQQQTEEEEIPQQVNENIDEELNSEDDEVEEEVKELIKPPLNLVHVNAKTIPQNSHIMKLKLLNILGIQPKPFDPSTYDDDESEDIVQDRKSFNLESVIRWKWGLDSNGRPIKESNTRLVQWSDGSCHLFIGSESLELKEHELNTEQFYVYSSHDGFIECEGKVNSRVTIRPTNIRSKVHQRLSKDIQDKTKKVGKIKSVQAGDPETERLRKTLTDELAKKSRRSSSANSINSYLEGDDNDSPSRFKSTGRSARQSTKSTSTASRKKSQSTSPGKRKSYDDYDDDDDYSDSDDSDYDDDEEDEDNDFIVDDDEEVYDDEEEENDEFINSNPKGSSSKKRDRENPSALMDIKKSQQQQKDSPNTKSSSNNTKPSQTIVEEDDDELTRKQVKKHKKIVETGSDDE
ncbi:RNA polymerase II complex component [Tieghemostelium lacteum]|uniref:RNA polymerase II complex component n=1 Tax=Tieghemostelium lacteum TaxID=361077 RepID=A0A151Z975_TIELA|nr:RNA polymerase II complex component [Tieghemostelium lacteum]|eukprot:KYQ90511.1 RNA polymerase II complex component [Tieghemostelium lacteum]